MSYIYSIGKLNQQSLMSKIVYDDIEAVTSLLHEKENDLELAAKIGQELLERNKILEERVSGLEVQLISNTELITQLRHNLTTKTELLHAYSNDAIDDYSPLKSKVGLETLQRKIRILEEENKLVRNPYFPLHTTIKNCFIIF